MRIFFLFYILFAITCFSGEATGRDTSWAQAVELPVLKNFYQVDDFLYRSAQPSEEAFVALADFGIKTVLSLRAEFDESAIVEAAGLKSITIRMSAWYIKDEDIVAALQIMQKASKDNPLLVHCLHGADRTGVVIAAYRIIIQNWEKEKAIEEMRKGGYGHHIIFANITDYLQKLDTQKIKNEMKIKENLNLPKKDTENKTKN